MMLLMKFDAGVCRDLDAARREWLETNGLGGFASSTITGMNTRRYHGLLVAALHPPTDRRVLLSKLDETLVLPNGERVELATNRYPNATIYPNGYKLQKSFRLDPFPIFTYRAGDIELEKSLFMPYGVNATVIRYVLRFPASTPNVVEATAASHANYTLELRPMLAFRDYHSMQHENTLALQSDELKSGTIHFKQVDGNTELFITSTAQSVSFENVWYRNFEYAEEQARGFDPLEDLLNPCVLRSEWCAGETQNELTCDVIASTKLFDESDAREIATIFETSERERRKQLEVSFFQNAPRHAFNDFAQQLHIAADAYIVKRASSKDKDLHSIIAGYHWFTDWGRDTMISLLGLVLATRQFDLARDILRAFASYMNEGLIPNRFPDYDEAPEYNTVDGTLWFFHAASEYLRRTNDEAFARDELYDKLKNSIAWHEYGTKYDIRMSNDCLLRAGRPDVQLTWMDAKVGDWVVTPRTGKPVEIQALWYNALRVTAELAWRFRDDETQKHCTELANTAQASFNAKFWNEAESCLYDCLSDDDTSDAAIRPNQIFAISLPHAILNPARAQSVITVVERELLTPYGLRSLSPRDSRYCARYEGNSLSRDGAYHQGTVWGWLIGAFITAYLKAHGRTPETLAKARTFTQDFRTHLHEAGLGHVSEIFDGDAPHTPRGCIAQAWSVAELLRCELEELI